MPLAQVAAQLRGGRLGLTSGLYTQPSLYFKKDPGSGLSLSGAGTVLVSIQKVDRLTITAAGLVINGRLIVDSYLTALGKITANNNNLGSPGLEVVAGGLTVTAGGLAITAGGANITGNLAQGGGTASVGPLTVNGTLHATGVATLDTTLSVGGLVTAQAGLTVSAGNLAVTTGNATVGGTLTSTGLLTAQGGLTATAAGTSSIRPLVIKRTADPATNNDETSLDVQNAGGTVVARLAAYRATATAWGWKFYMSTGGSLNNGLTIDDTAKVTTANLDVAGTLTVSNGALNVNGGALSMGGNLAIVPAPVSGTPAQHGLFRGNVVKAWARVDLAGGLRAGFNVGTPTKNATGDYTVPFLRAFADVYFACVATPAMNGAYFASTPGFGTGYVQVKTFNASGAAADAEFSVIAIGNQ